MSNQNIYLAYKRDTEYIVYWLLNTTNRLIKTHAPVDKDGQPFKIFATGDVTLYDVMRMADLVADYARPTPSLVFHLLQSAITIRAGLLKEQLELAATNSNPRLKDSIASHQLYLQTFNVLFTILGGDNWQPDWNQNDFRTIDDSDAQGILVSSLSFDFSTEATSDGESEAESEAGSNAGPSTTGATSRRKHRKQGKGKKSKKGKRTTKPSGANEPIVVVPLKDCEIVGDIRTRLGDYLMAANAAATEWAALRSYLQGVWRAVAYEDYNSAVAGAQSRLAVSMIRKATIDLFADFPTRRTYECVLDDLLRMTAKDSPSGEGHTHEWNVWLRRRGPNGEDGDVTGGEVMDVAEQLMQYAWLDLSAFIEDFRKNRTGKPTKAMQKKLSDWDPCLDLASASPRQRIVWRSKYTISWLYDLVNHHAGTELEVRKKQMNPLPLHEINWSMTGPCGNTTSVLGLTGFASFVTQLAMQKPTANYKDKIFPRHVFELQCIVDSFTVSRGWSIDIFKGHVLEPPPDSFKSTRDLDIFLYGDKSRGRPGFFSGADKLIDVLQNRRSKPDEFTKYQTAAYVVQAWRIDVSRRLTVTPISTSVAQTRSQFPAGDSRAVLEYSPWLCGVSLVSALDLTYRTAMYIWELIPDPAMLLVMYGPLAREDSVKKVGFLEDARTFFPDIFTSTWLMIPHPSEASAIYANSQAPCSSSLVDTKRDHEKPRRLFKTKSQLQVFSEGNWDLDSLAEHELVIGSRLWSLHLSQTKQTIDPVTGKIVLEDTKLVRRLRNLVMFDDLIENHIAHTRMFARHLIEARSTRGGVHLSSADGTIRAINSLDFSSRLLAQQCVSKAAMLDLIQYDIHDDVCGSCPHSGIDYMALTLEFMRMFAEVERKLHRVKSPADEEMIVRKPPAEIPPQFVNQFMTQKWNNKECPKIIREMFQNSTIQLDDYRIWEKRDDEGEAAEMPEAAERDQPCAVM